MPKITLLSDLIYLHFLAKLLGPGNKNHVFSTFTVRLKTESGKFLFLGVSRETTAKKQVEITTNWSENAYESPCVIIWSFFLSLLLLLIQISRGFCVRVDEDEEEKAPKKLREEAKNNEKRHNYMHA